MYTVDLFVQEAARLQQKPLSEQVLEEFKTVREEVQAERLVETRYRRYQPITPEILITHLIDSERWAITQDGFVGLHSFVRAAAPKAVYIQ